MTHKEKAMELVEKFMDASIVEEEVNYFHPKPYSLAKQCAIIAVDEILYFMDMFNLDLEMTHQHKWWQQVRTEIENL